MHLKYRSVFRFYFTVLCGEIQVINSYFSKAMVNYLY